MKTINITFTAILLTIDVALHSQPVLTETHNKVRTYDRLELQYNGLSLPCT